MSSFKSRIEEQVFAIHAKVEDLTSRAFATAHRAFNNDSKEAFGDAMSGFRKIVWDLVADSFSNNRQLQPMSTAPKNGDLILVHARQDLNGCGKWFIVQHSSLPENDPNNGWMMTSPAGHGGFPDEWFKGWMPLPKV